MSTCEIKSLVSNIEKFGFFLFFFYLKNLCKIKSLILSIIGKFVFFISSLLLKKFIVIF